MRGDGGGGFGNTGLADEGEAVADHEPISGRRLAAEGAAALLGLCRFRFPALTFGAALHADRLVAAAGLDPAVEAEAVDDPGSDAAQAGWLLGSQGAPICAA